MLGRNEEKLNRLKENLQREIPSAQIEILVADMSQVEAVFAAAEQMKNLGVDILVHNAGAYKVPRYKTSCGYDNVFTVNFISPYILTRRLMNAAERIVVVGSIAHNYSKSDENDIDFSGRKAASLVYGNSKRYLMFSHFELQGKGKAEISIVHPGITLTGIMEHFPKLIYFFIKPIMKVVFMKPKSAAESIALGFFCNTPKYSWLGPRFLSVWGRPKLKRLKTTKEEVEKITQKSAEIYNFVENMQKN